MSLPYFIGPETGMSILASYLCHTSLLGYWSTGSGAFGGDEVLVTHFVPEKSFGDRGVERRVVPSAMRFRLAGAGDDRGRWPGVS